jgi:hypothetical protein
MPQRDGACRYPLPVPHQTHAGVEAKLPYLRDLGITAIELMPLNDVPGRRNWDFYDGVLLNAPNAIMDARRISSGCCVPPTSTTSSSTLMWSIIISAPSSTIFTPTPSQFSLIGIRPAGARRQSEGPQRRLRPSISDRQCFDVTVRLRLRRLAVRRGARAEGRFQSIFSTGTLRPRQTIVAVSG